MTEIQEKLFALADADYRAFQCRLMPTVPPGRVIGVRTPALRKLAKELAKTDLAGAFLDTLPHTYYEENNLHAFLLDSVRDFDSALARTDAFLPYVDNWATCDSFSPRAFAKTPERLLPKIKEWLSSGQTYTVRFGIEMLMTYFLDERFDPAYPEWVAAVSSEEYYVRMMQAWYFATALTKQYDAVLPFIENGLPEAWTHNKAIQKAIESRCISDKRKDYLRSLKRK